MTTEVLRNMIYARSATLDGLGYVVMDEVHYLADAARGGVWEEVILLLAPDARLVSLSATVSNAEEFGRWLTEVRGPTAVVVSERRPVPLWQQMMVRKDLFGLYAASVDATDPGHDPRINPDLLEAIRRAERADTSGYHGHGPRARGAARRDGGRGRNPGRGRSTRHGRDRGGVRTPRRDTVVTALDADGLLPAIYFIFSRAGCEAAVDQVLASGVRFTTPTERDLIAETLHEISMRIPGEDLAAVGFTSFAQALTRGVAAHHAGMLPVFKEAVEQLFAAGLIKVVFATETLALGINMPARSVVLESLVKWDGRAHTAITPGEYTQLTGRAGRRGIDVEGHAVVLYASGVDPEAVAGLASRRTYPLRSSFRPTYNMAVNLLTTRSREQVRELLEQSFAQFQADAGVVHLARQLHKHEEAIAGYTASAACDQGDIGEYLALRARITALESAEQKDRSAGRRRAVTDQLASLRPGDVIEIPRGRRAGWAVVLAAGTPGLDGPRPEVLGEDRTVRQIGHAEAPHGVRVAGRVRIPKGFSARDPRQRRNLASSLRNALAEGLPGGSTATLPETGPSSSAQERADELAQARRRLRAHPVHGCADREDHLRWARRLETLEAEREKRVRRIASRTTSIARDFDRVCEVLLTLGYLAQEETTSTENDGESGAEPPTGTHVTAAGRWLRRLYAERDLVLAQTLRSGHWDHLDPAELAAAATTIVYSPRGDDDDRPAVPRGLGPRLDLAVATAMSRGDEVADLERQVGLSPPARSIPDWSAPCSSGPEAGRSPTSCPAATCSPGTSCAGPARCSTCSTRSPSRPRRPACGAGRAMRSTWYGAASSGRTWYDTRTSAPADQTRPRPSARRDRLLRRRPVRHRHARRGGRHRLDRRRHRGGAAHGGCSGPRPRGAPRDARVRGRRRAAGLARRSRPGRDRRASPASGRRHVRDHRRRDRRRGGPPCAPSGPARRGRGRSPRATPRDGPGRVGVCRDPPGARHHARSRDRSLGPAPARSRPRPVRAGGLPRAHPRSLAGRRPRITQGRLARPARGGELPQRSSCGRRPSW